MRQQILFFAIILLALSGRAMADDVTFSEGYIPQGGTGVVTVYSTVESNHYNGFQIEWSLSSHPVGLEVTQIIPSDELLVTYPDIIIDFNSRDYFGLFGFNLKDVYEYLPIGEKVPICYIYFKADESFKVGDEIVLDVNDVEYSLIQEDDSFLSVHFAGTSYGLENKQIVLHIGNPEAEAYAHLSSDGTTLTFYYDNLKESRTGTVYDMNGISEYPVWTDEEVAAGITRVAFDSSFQNYLPGTAYGWFYMMGLLTHVDGMAYFDTSNVSEMTGMFLFCDQLTSLDVSHFDTSKVTNMWAMFYGCSGLTSLDVSRFDTSNVTDLTGLFYGCSSLTSLDVSSFDTSSASSLMGMFYGCSSLTSLDVSHFDTSNATDTRLMFAYCYGLDHLFVSPTMTNLDDNACTGVGTASNPCIIHAPVGFDFGVSTSGSYFQWKGGYFRLANDAILGDVNADGVLSISDPVCLFGWLLEIAQPTFVESVADYNQDTYVTVSDGVAIIADLRGGNSSVARRQNAPALATAHDAVRLACNSEGFGVALDNESIFTAFSMGVTLPEGETLRGVTLDSRRADGHTLSFRQLADGTYRVLCFSPDLQPIAGHEGLLLTFETDSPFSGSVIIDNIRFSDLVGQEKVLAPVANEPTGIHEVEGEAGGTPRYTLDGKRSGGTSHGIYIQGGRKIVGK